MVFEGIPGGPMDCWKDVTSPAEHLARSKWILDTFLPWEAERCRNVELTDANGILAGAFAPTVRKPIGLLPSGKAVLGLADAVCLNDPITGQGSNNASKAARSLPWTRSSRMATGRSTRPSCRRPSTATGTTPSSSPAGPTPCCSRRRRTCSTSWARRRPFPVLAKRIANGFDDPRDLFPWFAVPEEADRYLQQLAA